MKSTALLASAIALLAQTARSHYIFNRLAIGGASGLPYEHIRHNTNHNSPVTDLKSPALRCNVGGASANGTTTASVTAGAKLTWMSDQKVYHQGPVSMYMTKVPSAEQADGSTKWFKIEDIGPKFTGKGQADWTAAQQQQYAVTIPKCLQSGEYLLRAQQLAIHNPGAPPQFYISCAQLKVTSGGSSAPPAPYLVNIPGAFKETDPGYKVNIWNNFNSYTVPGPKVWSCGSA